MEVGLKVLLEAAQGAEPQCFWHRLPGVPVLGVNEKRADGERKEADSGCKQIPPSADGCAV